MTRLRNLSAGLLLAISFAAQPAAAELKVGYIDSEVHRQQMPEFKQIQRQLERLQQSYEQEAMDRQSKLVKLQEDFRKQELLMSEAKKAEMEAEFELAMQELQQFTQEKLAPNGELFQKNIELSAPVFETVNEALKKLAEEEGYDFILDVAGNGTIVYADPERYNVTNKLLEILAEAREEVETEQ